MLLVSKGLRLGEIYFYAKTTLLLLTKQKDIKKLNLTLDRGSLGSWVDEDRSKLRVAM